jgi:hypothetical protein
MDFTPVEGLCDAEVGEAVAVVPVVVEEGDLPTCHREHMGQQEPAYQVHRGWGGVGSSIPVQLR